MVRSVAACAAAGMLVLSLGGPVRAEPQCSPRQVVIDYLLAEFQEQPVGKGVANNGGNDTGGSGGEGGGPVHNVGGFGNFGQNYGASRFDTMGSFGSNYTTPGWQRAQARKARGGFEEDQSDYVSDEAITEDTPARARTQAPKRRMPLTIEGELVAKSTGTVSPFGLGDRVFHQKFGNGNVTHIDGNKLTIAFDKAGEKRVVDSFVERV